MHTTSSIGGVETWLDRASAHFSAHGFDTVVGLVRGMKFNQPDRYRASHPQLQTVEVDGRGLDREGRVRALARCVAGIRPDIVLPLGIVDANDAVIRRKQAGESVRLLARAQGNLPPMLADLRAYRDWIDRVICPGRLTRQVLVDWADFSPGRVLNISNGADRPALARRARASGSPLRLGYVGRLSQPDKRAMDLVPLCRELTGLGVDFQLDIVGDGPCMAELRGAMAEWGGRVRLHGALSHEDLYRNVYPSLDALILTSASEAFGIVLVEALMHGVVPVSSRYDGFHCERLVIEGKTGLAFEVGDMASAAQAVRSLELAPELLVRLSRAAEAHGQEYSWERSLEKWLLALADLSSEPVLRADSAPAIATRAHSGRLQRWGVPEGATDLLRRLRRATLGPPIEAGGEEWPLYHRSHPPAVLEEVRRAIAELELAGAKSSAGC